MIAGLGAYIHSLDIQSVLLGTYIHCWVLRMHCWAHIFIVGYLDCIVGRICTLLGAKYAVLGIVLSVNVIASYRE
jgi:hypothetical protein